MSPLACLQVDIFHGYLVLGLPFETETGLLEHRFEDPQLSLSRVSPKVENAFRMLQIHSLLLHQAPVEKVARYRAKVIENHSNDKTALRLRLRHEFGGFGEQALDALIKNSRPDFRRAMRLSKACFMVRFWARHPGLSLRCFLERCRDHWLRFVWHPCGFVIPVHAPSEDDRKLLRSVLDSLVQKKVLPAWTDSTQARARISWREYQVLERGGISVKWTGPSKNALDLGTVADPNELAAVLLAQLIGRDHPLYIRTCATTKTQSGAVRLSTSTECSAAG
jgi:hypothetical protein